MLCYKYGRVYERKSEREGVRSDLVSSHTAPELMT